MRTDGWIFLLASWSAIVSVLSLCLYWTIKGRNNAGEK